MGKITTSETRRNELAERDMQHSRLDHIQLLRAVAVLSVLFSHVTFELKRLLVGKQTILNDKFFPGDFGVDLFFIISGFIMVYTCWNKFSENGASLDFVKRRLIRIVPLYWVTTSLMIAVIIAMPDRVHTATSDVWQWITSYLFIPYAREGDGFIRPVLGLGWSLQYEMVFYAVFAIGLLFSRGVGLAITIGGVMVIYLLSAFGAGDGAIARFLGHQIILEFSLGASIGALYMSNLRLPNRVCIWSGIVGVALLAISPNFDNMVETHRLVFYGFPALLIVVAVVFPAVPYTRQVSKPALILGHTSYSIYLTHPFVVGIMAIVVKRLGMIESASANEIIAFYAFSTILVSLVVGIACHYIFDEPFTNWIKRNMVRSKKPTSKLSSQYHKLVGAVS